MYLLKVISAAVSKGAMMASLIAILLVPQMAYSQSVEENPSALAMTGDLVIARPLLLVTTVLGTAVFLVSLPFSAAGGNTLEAAETLVVGPAEATFVRCLGCTRSGYKKETKELDE